MDVESAMETDSLLVEYMDPNAVTYSGVSTVSGGSSNGAVGRRRSTHSSEDEEMLDIAMDGRDDQGIAIDGIGIDRSQGRS